MITELKRIIQGTYDHANTQINFDANPFLLANNDLTLYFTDNDSRFNAKVVSVSANSAVVNFSDPQFNGDHVVVHTTAFNNGVSGPQDTFSWKFTNPPNAILQVSSNGGSANVNLEVSTDEAHWVTLATFPIREANANSSFINVTSPWPYGRLNITDISANTTITANKVI